MSKRVKGGAEKERDKKKKKRDNEAAHCHNIGDMFTSINVKKTGPKSDKLDDHTEEDPAIRSSSACADAESQGITELEACDRGEVNVCDTICHQFVQIDDTLERLEPHGSRDDYALVSIDNENAWEKENTEYENRECGTVDKFKRPSNNDYHTFFKIHPIQPTHNDKLKFNPSLAYFREDIHNKKIRRQWLSFCNESNTFFCSFCLAFSKEANSFTEGCKIDPHRIYDRIKEHEKTNAHQASAESFLLKSKMKDIRSMFTDTSRKSEEINQRRNVLKRIVETVKTLGKRGQSFRGAKDAEAAYTLDDTSADHGNFLEVLLLLSKFDPLLKVHIDKSIQLSREAHLKKTDRNRPGRSGSVNTFLSKTTVNYIIESISSLMKKNISEEINKAGMFSIQIDSTQDINVHDQLSVIVRYVSEDVRERLIGLINCTSSSSTGANLYQIVTELLVRNGINVKNCIGSATDGASNMQGQYKGFSTYMEKELTGQVHVWCYAHVLNLVMANTTSICVEAISLFGIINQCAVFIRESYKRMAVWDIVTDKKKKMLSSIGETRWWAKDKALTKLFGHYNNPKNAAFIEIILTLEEIASSSNFANDARFKAKSIADSLKKFELILSANIFLKIFESTTPLSKYLQTNGMNPIMAFKMVEQTITTLKTDSRNFKAVLAVAKKFIVWANSRMDEVLEQPEQPETDNVDGNIGDTLVEVEVEKESYFASSFAARRIIRRNKMPGERSNDECIADPEKRFETQVYNVIYDNALQSLENRFTGHQKLFLDLAWLDPSYFGEIDSLPDDSFQSIANQITKHSGNVIVTSTDIQSELKDFAKKWSEMKAILVNEGSKSMSKEEESEYITVTICQTCKNCVVCCFKVLLQYKLHTMSYNNLYNAYKYVLTLSCTQVSCERTFSKLKFVQNRLRSCLTQEHLDALLLMSVEKDIIVNMDTDDIINDFATKSESLKKMLIL